jgi:hypothetical protein
MFELPHRVIEVGARHQELIDDLAYRTSWRLRIASVSPPRSISRPCCSSSAPTSPPPPRRLAGHQGLRPGRRQPPSDPPPRHPAPARRRRARRPGPHPRPRSRLLRGDSLCGRAPCCEAPGTDGRDDGQGCNSLGLDSGRGRKKHAKRRRAIECLKVDHGSRKRRNKHNDHE